MILLLEGVVLGLFLVLACAFAIKDGAVGAVQLYTRRCRSAACSWA